MVKKYFTKEKQKVTSYERTICGPCIHLCLCFYLSSLLLAWAIAILRVVSLYQEAENAGA